MENRPNKSEKADLVAPYDPETNPAGDGRFLCITGLVEGVHLLSVSGEIDSSVHGDFKGAIETAVTNAHSPLVIDLTGVRYIDSSGFTDLIGARKRMTERNDRLYLVSNRAVHRLLRILGLDQVFEVYATQREAVRC